jgi:predicted metal-dependent phosphoesterase TrpH
VIDLHTHTCASDGTDTPEQLIDRAVALHLTALAITDHDTLKAHETAHGYAAGKPLRLITGIELSTRVPAEKNPSFRTAHILGYFRAAPDGGFVDWLETLRVQRKARNVALSERLRSLGFDVPLGEVESLGRNIAGRPHFAKIMVAKGYCRSHEEAFRLYLGETGAAYVEREDPSVEEGLERLRQAGALPFLAHPTRSCPPDQDPRPLLAGWKEAGLAGLEVWHPDHGERERSRLTNLAKELRLMTSGGSDYHGANKAEIRLGHGRHGEARTPDSVLEQFDW